MNPVKKSGLTEKIAIIFIKRLVQALKRKNALMKAEMISFREICQIDGSFKIWPQDISKS
jgi:hypothetical protein